MLFHGRRNLNHLLEDLESLHIEWKAKSQFEEGGQGLWLAAVIFGIEIGHARIAEEAARSNIDVDRLIARWKHIRKSRPKGPASESLKGVDYGISLVMGCVRRHLNPELPPHPKPPASADGRKSRSERNRASGL